MSSAEGRVISGFVWIMEKLLSLTGLSITIFTSFLVKKPNIIQLSVCDGYKLMLIKVRFRFKKMN